MKWIITALLLTGCAGKEIVREPVEVEMPVAVPCVSQNDIPDTVPSAADTVDRDAAAGEKIKAILVERERLRSQNKGLRGLLVNCTE